MPALARMGRGTKVSQVEDGMSNTVMLSELLAWDEENAQGIGDPSTNIVRNDDWRGTWMIPCMGASAFSGFTLPNSGEPDLIPACGSGIENSPQFREMPCEEKSDQFNGGNIYAAARSRHPGGVNAAMADASVRFVSEDVDEPVWQAACTRAGAETLEAF